MAVTALSLHEQDPDDIAEGSSREEEEDHPTRQRDRRDTDTQQRRCEDHAAGSHSSQLARHLLLLRKRISQTCPQPISPQALLLLGQAAIKPTASISTSLPPDDPIVAPLYNELESLRELIPAQPTKMQAHDESSPSCLITNALDYIDHMNEEIQSLHETIQETLCYPNARNRSCDQPTSTIKVSNSGMVKVEHLKDLSLHVQIQCKQRKGLLASLLLELENLGLVIDRMDVSCNQMLTLDVITSKVKLKMLEGKFVEQVLQGIISNSFSNI